MAIDHWYEVLLMFVKLDPEVTEILCCPFCKSDVHKTSSAFYCENCGLIFPRRKVKVSDSEWEEVYDFRIQKPSYCLPYGTSLWEDIQVGYEDFSKIFGERDSLKEYLDEIDSVKEIYTEEFHIAGRVLDIGGHQGRLRHYLREDVSLYVSIDPYIDVFEGILQQPNLIKAYPRLLDPCNFIAAHAEHLPFRSKSFDWIHMRSVVDHFEDPYQAFLEAFRCCRTDGRILVGLAIIEKIQAEQSLPQDPSSHRKSPLWARVMEKVWKEGLIGIAYAAIQRIIPRPIQPKKDARDFHDDHLYRLTHAQLMDLLQKTGWSVTKQHWQKPPFHFCIYVSAVAVNPIVGRYS